MKATLSARFKWRAKPLSINVDGLRLQCIFVCFNVLSATLFFALHRIWNYRKKVIVGNLERSFPDVAKTDRAVLLEKYYRHLADLAVEPFLLNVLETAELSNLARYENISLINNCLHAGKNVVLMVSHYGNWEYLLTLPLVTNYRIVAAYAAISNSFFDRQMKNFRSKYGIELVEKNAFYRHVMTDVCTRPTLYIIVADQRPAGISRQSVYFLNQKAAVQAGAEKIAYRHKCAVIYLDVQRLKKHTYAFRFELISANPASELSGFIMKRYYQMLEKTISRQPELWLWSHNRWKNPVRTECVE